MPEGRPFFFTSVERLGRDLSYAARTLVRNAAFTVIGILSIGFGIGMNTAVFTVADPLLLQRLPVSDPEGLVIAVRNDADRPGAVSDSVPYPLLAEMQDVGEMFEGSFIRALSGSYLMKLGGVSGPELEVRMVSVSGGYFSTLGVQAALGRVFGVEDEKPGSPPVVVISHALWRRTFGEDPGVIGASIVLSNPPALEDVPVTIVGVGPEGFRGVNIDEDPDIWIPFARMAELDLAMRVMLGFSPERVAFPMMARLSPGTTLDRAEAMMNVAASRTPANPGSDRRGLALRPGGSGYSQLREQFVEPLMVLAAAVAALLIMACVNVGALVLAREARRRREWAVRLATGCSRLGLTQQVLVETFLIAGLGGFVGLLSSYWAGNALASFLPADSEFLGQVGMDVRVLGFTAAALAASVLIFGAAPALQAARLDPATILKDQGSRSGRARSIVTVNKWIVAGQVGFATFLVIVAGLFVRTIQNLRAVDTGFDRNVVQFEIDEVPGESIDDFDMLGAEILGQIEALPEVESSTLYNWFGLLSGRSPQSPVQVRPGSTVVETDRIHAGPNFFETLDIPILAGRGFRAADGAREGESPVVVVSERLARALFGDANPLGRRILYDSDPVEVIGVAGDAIHADLRGETRPTIYRFFDPVGTVNTRFAVRTRGDPARVIPAIQGLVPGIDDRVFVSSIGTMAETVEQALVRERLLARLTGVFGLVALLLTALGVFGVLSYTVSQRKGEIGIRMAMGASRVTVVRLIVAETVPVVGVGVAAGVGAALAAERLIGSLLFGLTITDPSTIVAAVTVLILAAAAAAVVPTWQAAATSPAASLRQE